MPTLAVRAILMILMGMLRTCFLLQDATAVRQVPSAAGADKTGWDSRGAW